MTKTKIRKEKLSIYLVRDHSKSDAQILNLEKAKDGIDIKMAEVDSAILYIKREPPKNSPPWTKLFTEAQDIPEGAFGQSSSVGAVLSVRLQDQVFMLAFGSGFHLLKTDAIERDFGLRVTLNSVDPDKLRSLDKASYDHNPLNFRTQSTKDVDIFELHVDSELEMLYAITGASKVGLFGSVITGRDALTLMVEVDLNGISKILLETINRYKAKLPAKFEWVDNINRVRDIDEIEILDLELDTVLATGQFSNLWLGEPEVIDWESQIGYSFDLYAKTPRHVVLNLSDYIAYLNERKMELSVDTMKNTVVNVNNNEYQETKHWSAYRCLYAEVVVGKEQYVLRNGVWYRVNADFVEHVDNYLSTLELYDYAFPTYAHDREEDYNIDVCDHDKNFTLMDKKNIRIGGAYDKLEFCDLIRDKSEFIHVKYYRSSSTLSHLFSQGAVAAEAFIRDIEFRQKLNSKLPKSIQLKDSKERPNPHEYKVVYVIATEKKLPDELPFFSKVTLKNALMTLRALDYKVELSAVKVDPVLLVKKKCKPKQT